MTTEGERQENHDAVSPLSQFCDIIANLPNYDVLPIVADYTPPSGCLSHPGASTREKGIILRDVAVANMVIAIEDEFSGAGDFHED